MAVAAAAQRTAATAAAEGASDPLKKGRFGVPFLLPFQFSVTTLLPCGNSTNRME